MAIRTELTLRLPNSPGALAGVCRVLADERVDLLALSVESNGHCHLVVEPALKAASLLRAQHHTVSERDVLVITVGPDFSGTAAVLALLRDVGVNINHAYSGIADSKASALVVSVDDAVRAAAAAGV